MNARRSLLISGGAAVAALALPARAQQGALEAMTPGENLMQEHGLVGRVMLIYRRAIDLIGEQKSFYAERVASASQIVSQVIHGHHEPEEEDIVFPVLERGGELKAMTAVLREQHLAARALTSRIGLELVDPNRTHHAAASMRSFIEMYEPHGTYENAIIYPAFRQAVGAKRYEELSQRWADNERRLQGTFEAYSAQLAGIEKALGLELADYTNAPPRPRRS